MTNNNEIDAKCKVCTNRYGSAICLKAQELRAFPNCFSDRKKPRYISSIKVAKEEQLC